MKCVHLYMQGPFVHVASLCAALLSKFMALFGGIYMVRGIFFLYKLLQPIFTLSVKSVNPPGHCDIL